MGGALGLGFQEAACRVNCEAVGVRNRVPLLLLDHMRQFMGQQAFPLGGFRAILPVFEDDPAARLYRPGRLLPGLTHPLWR